MNMEDSRLGLTSKYPVFEEVQEGMTLPTLVKQPTNVTLFMFRAALWITSRIHYDSQFIRSKGYKDVIVHGPLQVSFLTQMITDWLGENGTLRKMSWRNQASAFPGDVLTCSGVIKSKHTEDGKGCLQLDLALENQNQERLVTGTATVYVPMRRSS